MLMEATNKITFDYSSVDEAFPPIDPGHVPVGYRVLFQLRTAKNVTKGGIIIPDEAKNADQWVTQVAKVVAVGPTAFCNRDTGNQWPEGPWAVPGDFVRVPKYGGDRFSVAKDGEEALFVIFRDADISAKVADPLSVRSYI